MAGDHPIVIEPAPQVVRVSFAGHVIAQSANALLLREASYPPVAYVPRQDVDMTALERTAHATHCPYKGDASYYSIKGDGRTAENAVWSYETPLPGVAAIAGHLAFYPNRVDEIAWLPK